MRRVELSDHAIEEMDDDGLALGDIRAVLLEGIIHARQKDDPRGTRYVVRGSVNDQSVDVVCRFLASDILWVVTVYTVGAPEMKTERDYSCEFCDSRDELEERLVTVYRHRQGQYFIFEQVPARVCRACGHRYFSWGIAEEMERLMAAPETQAHTKPVPVVPLTPVR